MKSIQVLYILLIIFSMNAYATVPAQITVEQKVRMADHVFIGSIYKVDMVNKKGKQVKNSAAQTGPGLANTIRLYVRVEPNGVLMTDVDPFPKEIIIPLWQMFHYSFGQIQGAHKEEEGDRSIFFLKGKEFEKVEVSTFQASINELEQVRELIRKKPALMKSNNP